MAQFRRCLLTAALIISPFFGASQTLAAECTLSTSAPSFSATLDPNSAPQPPAQPSCPSGLELYRVQLELFRKNTVEAYNRKLSAFSSTLQKTDEDFRAAAAKGNCSWGQYEILKTSLNSEFDKLRNDYKEPYDESMNAYWQYFRWYRDQAARCALSDAFPIDQNIRVSTK